MLGASPSTTSSSAAISDTTPISGMVALNPCGCSLDETTVIQCLARDKLCPNDGRRIQGYQSTLSSSFIPLLGLVQGPAQTTRDGYTRRLYEIRRLSEIQKDAELSELLVKQIELTESATSEHLTPEEKRIFTCLSVLVEISGNIDAFAVLRFKTLCKSYQSEFVTDAPVSTVQISLEGSQSSSSIPEALSLPSTSLSTLGTLPSKSGLSLQETFGLLQQTADLFERMKPIISGSSSSSSSDNYLLRVSAFIDSITPFLQHITPLLQQQSSSSLKKTGDFLESANSFLNQATPLLREAPSSLQEAGSLLEKISSFFSKNDPNTEMDRAKEAKEKGDKAFLACHLQEAELEYRTALEIMQKQFPEDHPNVAYALIDLGIFMRSSCRFELAAKLFTQALNIHKRLHIEDHPDVAECLTELGHLCFECEKFDQAKDYYSKALRLQRRLHFGDHPDLASALMDVSIINDRLISIDTRRHRRLVGAHAKVPLQRANYTREALLMICRYHKIPIAINSNGSTTLINKEFNLTPLSPIHSASSSSISSSSGTEIHPIPPLLEENPQRSLLLASLFSEWGAKLSSFHNEHLHLNCPQFAPSDAGEHFSKTALEMLNILFKEKDKPEFLEHLLRYNERYATELSQATQALELVKKTYHPLMDHPHIATALHCLGKLLEGKRDYREAFKYFEEEIKMYERLYPEGHYLTSNALNHIQANLLVALGQSSEANSYKEKIIMLEKKVFGPDFERPPYGRIDRFPEALASLRNRPKCRTPV